MVGDQDLSCPSPCWFKQVLLKVQAILNPKRSRAMVEPVEPERALVWWLPGADHKEEAFPPDADPPSPWRTLHLRCDGDGGGGPAAPHADWYSSDSGGAYGRSASPHGYASYGGGAKGGSAATCSSSLNGGAKGGSAAPLGSSSNGGGAYDGSAATIGFSSYGGGAKGGVQRLGLSAATVVEQGGMAATSWSDSYGGGAYGGSAATWCPSRSVLRPKRA